LDELDHPPKLRRSRTKQAIVAAILPFMAALETEQGFASLGEEERKSTRSFLFNSECSGPPGRYLKMDVPHISWSWILSVSFFLRDYQQVIN